MHLRVELLIIPGAIALGAIVALFLVRSLALRLLHRWSATTETRLDDIIISSFRIPSIYWCVAIGLYTGIFFSDLPDKYVFYLTRTIHIIIIFSITIASATLSGKIFKNYIQQSNLPLPTTGLAYGIVKGTILVIGFLIILSVLGISITPIITALGVGGLAVALALQDTLANLFAGIHILVEKSIRVGRSANSAAKYYLKGQNEVSRFLQSVLEALKLERAGGRS